MTKSKTYSFNNIFVFLIVLSLFGCGNTLIKPSQEVEIISRNSVNTAVKEFKLTKLREVSDFDRLPNEFNRFKNQINQFDFYFAQSPTQNTGGFIFKAVNNSGKIIICLQKPAPLSAVTTALTNPIALLRVNKNIVVEMNLDYCRNT